MRSRDPSTDYTLALLIAEEDDLGDEIVNVVGSIRRAGAEPEIVAIDGPVDQLGSLLRRRRPGVFFLCLTANLDPACVQAVKRRFAEQPRTNRRLYAVRLDREHARTVAAVESRIAAWRRARERPELRRGVRVQTRSERGIKLDDVSGVIDLAAIEPEEPAAPPVCNTHTSVEPRIAATATETGSTLAPDQPRAVGRSWRTLVLAAALPSAAAVVFLSVRTAEPQHDNAADRQAIESQVTPQPMTTKPVFAVASPATPGPIPRVGRPHERFSGRNLWIETPPPPPRTIDTRSHRKPAAKAAVEDEAGDPDSMEQECRDVRRAASLARAAGRWDDELEALSRLACWPSREIHRELRAAALARQRAEATAVEAPGDTD